MTEQHGAGDQSDQHDDAALTGAAHPNDPDAPNAAAVQNEAAPQDPLSKALGASRLGALEPGERPSAGAILDAMGGIRGLVESLLPGILFLVLFTITRDVMLSIIAPLVVSVLFVVLRIVVRGQSALAFAGLIGVGISAALALLTGDARDNFVWGFITNAVIVVAIVVSMLMRRPLVGVLVGGFTQAPRAWREDAAKVAVGWRATILWLAVIGARLAVQVPLYLANTDLSVSILATAKLIMGVPLYAAALWVTWLMVRAVIDAPGAAKRADTPHDEVS